MINIAVQIGTKFIQFGELLLDDRNGSRTKQIAKENSYDAEQINTVILKEWLSGRGKHPVTWETLIEVLRDIKLRVLACDIRGVVCPRISTSKVVI